MSDLYELGFRLTLKQDLPCEVQETLTYMTRSDSVNAEPPSLNHPFFHIKWFNTEWTYLIANPRDNDEAVLGTDCGSVLMNGQLAFRGLIHEDPFWNTWYQFADWLLSISSSTGLIGYYRNINYDARITLFLFQESIRELDCKNQPFQGAFLAFLDFDSLSKRAVET